MRRGLYFRRLCPLVVGLTITSEKIMAISPAIPSLSSRPATSQSSSPEFRTMDWRWRDVMLACICVRSFHYIGIQDVVERVQTGATVKARLPTTSKRIKPSDLQTQAEKLIADGMTPDLDSVCGRTKTIRRKPIHRESFRASVLHHCERHRCWKVGEEVSLDNTFALIEGDPKSSERRGHPPQRNAKAGPPAHPSGNLPMPVMKNINYESRCHKEEARGQETAELLAFLTVRKQLCMQFQNTRELDVHEKHAYLFVGPPPGVYLAQDCVEDHIRDDHHTDAKQQKRNDGDRISGYWHTRLTR